jgi:hypothetical protein
MFRKSIPLILIFTLIISFFSCEKNEKFTEVYLVKFKNASLDNKNQYGVPISLDTISFTLDGTIDTVHGMSGVKYEFGRLAPGKETDFIAVKPGKYAIIVNDTLFYKNSKYNLRYWQVTESNIECIFQVVIESNQYNFWRSQLEMNGQPMIIPY